MNRHKYTISSMCRRLNLSRSTRSPSDNALAESTYKTFKVEFVYPTKFNSQKQLSNELDNYVHWWNCLRVNETLSYQTPISYCLIRQHEV